MSTLAFILGQSVSVTPNALNASGVTDPGAVITNASYTAGGSDIVTLGGTNPIEPTLTAAAVGSASFSATLSGTDSDGAPFSVTTPAYPITVSAPSVTTVSGSLTFGTPTGV